MFGEERQPSVDITGQLSLFWNPNHWVPPLTQFAKSTTLSITVYDCLGQRRMDPISTHPLGKLFESSGHWEVNGKGSTFERSLALRAIDSGQVEICSFEDALLVAALPAIARGEVIGVFVTGWVFNHFTDSMECERLTRCFHLLRNELWYTAREQAPVSRERFQTYLDLFETLTKSVINQLVSVEDLLEANRVKDEFLAAVSHELRTPLTSMQLRVDMLLRQKELDEKVVAALGVISRGIKTQTRLVDDLLDASRMITGKLRMDTSEIDILEVSREAIETAQPAANAKQIILEASLPAEVPTLIGDPIRIQQILWNLVTNAVKFTPQGGRVWVTLTDRKEDVVIEVKDTGCGIDPEFIPYIFDPFSQSRASLQSSKKGLGLGLAIAKYIVGLHGGLLSASSEGRGKGATFRLALPKWNSHSKGRTPAVREAEANAPLMRPPSLSPESERYNRQDSTLH